MVREQWKESVLENYEITVRLIFNCLDIKRHQLMSNFFRMHVNSCAMTKKHFVRSVTFNHQNLIGSPAKRSSVPYLKIFLAHSLETGLEVKYLIMRLCITGIRQQHSTTAFTAMIPEKQH